MRHHEDSGIPFVLCPQKRVDDGARGFGIQIAGRLIRQNQGWTVYQCARDRGALFFTAGDLSGVFIPDVRNPEQCTQLIGFPFHGRIDFPADDAGEYDVVAHGQSVEQKKILKDKAELLIAHSGKLGFLQRRKIGIVQQNAAGVRCQVTGNAVEQGGFSRTGRSHDCDKLSAVNLKRDTAQYGAAGFSRLKRFVKITDLKQKKSPILPFDPALG